MHYYLHVVLLGVSSMLEMLNVLQSEMMCPRVSLVVNALDMTVYYNSRNINDCSFT